jgi:hypothetical protein
MLSKGFKNIKEFKKITIRTHFYCYTISRDIKKSNIKTKRSSTYENDHF